MESRKQAISAIFLAVVITTGAFVPFVQPATAQNESPSPTLDDVDIPDEVTVGESFEVAVDASNNGGRAGAYSTITVSSPDLDGAGDGSQIAVTDDADHSYSSVSDAGDEIYDKNGDSMTADYALAEAGTIADRYWNSGESRSFDVEVTPETTGTLVINVRVTLSDDADSTSKYTAPSYGSKDQQGFIVRQYEVEVTEETDISATIDDVNLPSGDYAAGEDVTTETTIRNTGNTEHEFYVGYSVRGPDGEWRDNDRSTHEPVSVKPGEEETVDVVWQVEDDAPTGEYDIWTSVYRNEDGDQLEGRLDDRQLSDVFDVTVKNSPPKIDADGPGSRTTVPLGERVKFEIDAEDSDGDLDGVEWYVESEYTGDTSELHGDTDSATWERVFDSPGTYEVEAVAFDKEQSYSDPTSWIITVEDPEEINAVIRNVDDPSGEITASESAETSVTIENTGNTEHEFYVGYSVRGPDGEWRDNDRSTHEPVSVKPGEEETVDVGWEVEDDAPTGEYDIWTSVHRDIDGDLLEGRLDDEQISNAFSVITEASQPSIQAKTPSSQTSVTLGEKLKFEVITSKPVETSNEIAWYVDGKHVETIASSSETVNWQTAFESPGEHTVSARAPTDAEDNVDSVSWTVEVSGPEVQTNVEWQTDLPESVPDEEQLTLTATGTIATEGEICLVNGANEINSDDLACRDLDAGEFEESFTVRSGTDFLTEDSEQTTLSLRVRDGTGEDTWSTERTIRTESNQSLTVTAEDEDGDPLTDAEVSVDGLGVETTNTEGKATFENTVESDSEVTVTDASGHIVETESIDPETVSVVVEFPQLEPVNGVIRNSNGEPLPTGTEVEIRGTSFVATIDSDGEFSLPYQLPAGTYTLHIEEYESAVLDVDRDTTTYEFQTIKTSKKELVSAREKAFTKGVVCGDPCWSARNYDEEHSLAYLSGWIITGFTPVAGWLSDGRDLGSSIVRGDEVDAGLSLIAIASGAAAAPKAAKSIQKFVGRYPGKTDEVAKLVLKSDKIPTSVLYKSVYRNAPDSVKAADDAVVLRLVDEGVDLNKVRIGEGVTKSNLDHISQQGKIDETRFIVKDRGLRSVGDESVDTVWLEKGSENAGLQHLHKDDLIRGFSDISDEDDVVEAIYKTVKNTAPKAADDTRGGYIYTRKPSGADKEIKVVVGSNGYVVNAYPN